MALSVKLEAFEGPLDLLLHLIEKNKVNIYDIPIAEITDQYMEYLDGMQLPDLDTMSEFLVMAAELLDIKARWLSGSGKQQEEEEDPREELAARLLEYKMYKYLSQELRDCMEEAGRNVYRGPSMPDEALRYEEPVDLDELTKGYDLDILSEIFLSVMKRQDEKTDPVRSSFGKIKKENISLDDRIAGMREYTKKHSRYSLRDLFKEDASREEVVVTFLAVLELMRSGEIRAVQEELFGDISITAAK